MSPPGVACGGCGTAIPAGGPLPFACPRAGSGDDIDHVLRFSIDVEDAELPEDGDPNPFVRYRRLSWVWQSARARGIADADYIELVRELDAEIATVDGAGFALTPYRYSEALGTFHKDETGNVGGSHKARHLMGIALHLAIIERCGAAPWTESPTLAIASCGNAALAAAVVARAADRPLRVFIPTWADCAVVGRLRDLGAELVVCERSDGDPPGDPCYHRFRHAVAAGALPFTCQGSDNGLTIDGGKTLGFELAAQHRATGAGPLTHLFVQVGGGALASATYQALELAAALGAIETPPALVAVQTEGGHPFVRAVDRLRAHALAPTRVLAHARAHRSEFMWPWENEPVSVATGILDDETYDWWQVARGVIESGGAATLASEDDIHRARELAAAAGVRTCATGAAGYAGLLALRGRGAIAGERAAVLFTGAAR